MCEVVVSEKAELFRSTTGTVRFRAVNERERSDTNVGGCAAMDG